MNENGIHVIYPMGRDKSINHPGGFDMYEGFTLRVIGYVINPRATYEHAIGKGHAYALMKIDQSSGQALSYAHPASKDSGISQREGRYYSYGDYYSFAVRGAYDSVKHDSYQMVEFERILDAVAFSWYGVGHWETLNGSCVHLSKHYYDWPPSKFPTSTGLDPYLRTFVIMEVGTLAHFSGIYNGPDEIRIIAEGGVQDLGRPVNSGITIRIAVRKTLNNFTFFADYNTDPVVGNYRDLVTSGHNYVPRFSMNFNIRHVYMEVYT